MEILFLLATGEPPCALHDGVSPLPLQRIVPLLLAPHILTLYSTPATLWARRLEAAAAIAPTMSSRKV